MDLASILLPTQIVPKMAATERWPAIVELIDHLDQNGGLQGETPEALLAALKEREARTSTGIGHGVAIPHTFSEKISEVIAVFGRSHEGIQFDAIDNAPVRFIVLFIVPRDSYHLHLRTLAAIAKMLNNGEVRALLGSAESPDEILEILSRRAPRN